MGNKESGNLERAAVTGTFDVAIGYRMKASILVCDDDEENNKNSTTEGLNIQAQQFVDHFGSYLSESFLKALGKAAERYEYVPK